MIRLQSLAHYLFFFKLLGFSDTDEIKYRNALLSHSIRYSLQGNSRRVCKKTLSCIPDRDFREPDRG